MRQAEELANRILQEQGYLIMGSRNDLKIGELRTICDHALGDCELGQVAVIGFATEQEYLDQEVRFGYGDGTPQWQWHKFYKVAAE